MSPIPQPNRFLLLLLLVTASNLTSILHAQENSVVLRPDNPVFAPFNNKVRLGVSEIDPLGNIYIAFSQPEGVAKISAEGAAEIVFTVAQLNAEGIQFGYIRALVVDDAGNVFVASEETDNVVRISADGEIQEVLTSEGDGIESVDNPHSLLVDKAGNLFVVAYRSRTIFRVDKTNNIELVMDGSGVEGYAFHSPSEMIMDETNNKYVSSREAIFRISNTGTVTALVTREDLFSWNIAPRKLAVDSFGNLYFSRGGSTVYRYTSTGEAEIVLDQTGDGTGEFFCYDSGPFGKISCEGYGNYLDFIEEIHVDDAQNVFVFSESGSGTLVTAESRLIFKLTPAGTVTTVGDLGSIPGGQFGNVTQVRFDDYGQLFFRDSIANSILRYGPVPIENEDDFRLDLPHQELIFDASGVNPVPAEYSITRYAANQNLPKEIAHLDTRTPPFSRLPWEEADTTSDVRADSNELIRTITSSLLWMDSDVTATLSSTRQLPGGRDLVTDLTFSYEDTPIYQASGLAFPLTTYSRYSSRPLMRRIYLGNDVIMGGALRDVILAYDGHDVLYGQQGNDELRGGRGSNIYFGGEGTDTVVLPHRRDDYLLSRNPLDDFIRVQLKTGYGNSDTELVAPDVEWIEFSDAAVGTGDIRYWGEAIPIRSQLVDDQNPSPIYRFYNPRRNAFFYTNNPDERTNIVRNSGPNNKSNLDWPYVYQGAKFQAAHSYEGGVPLYRFYNTRTGHHFFTASEAERQTVLDKIANAGWSYVDEGIAFYVYGSDPTPNSVGNELPVYRYYSRSLNRHFFTTSETEAIALDQSGDWTFEGIGFYAEVLAY